MSAPRLIRQKKFSISLLRDMLPEFNTVVAQSSRTILPSTSPKTSSTNRTPWQFARLCDPQRRPLPLTQAFSLEPVPQREHLVAHGLAAVRKEAWETNLSPMPEIQGL